MTTLVLGAGSSVPYGLPTGPALTQQAVELLTSEARTKYDEFLEQEVHLNNFKMLSTHLRRSRTPTLDHYIQHNEKYSDELKMAIAGRIWEKEREALDPPDMPNDDWISWLYHEYLGAPSPEEIELLNVVFLSFNYDRLPIALLATMMANTHIAPIDHCVEAILKTPPGYSDCLRQRTLHIHGQLNAPLERYRDQRSGIADDGRLSNESHGFKTSTESAYRRLAETILVIHEKTEETQQARVRCKKAMTRADHVVFLGFGYHESNIGRLGISSFRFDKEFDSSTRLGGTAFDIKGNSRDVLSNRLQSRFVLGTPDERCRDFLSRFLT